MDLAIVIDISITLLKMLHPVKTYILNLWRKVLLYLAILDVYYKYTESVRSTDILLKSCRHQPYTAIG
jgi:hypothetical protein